ncbi:MAG: hypothetical protein QM529_07640 [Hydrotalea sp.]|nr:hypothetical protein [Hydrotalea sp.]
MKNKKILVTIASAMLMTTALSSAVFTTHANAQNAGNNKNGTGANGPLLANAVAGKLLLKADVGYVYSFAGDWNKSNSSSPSIGGNTSTATGGVGYGVSLGWTSKTGFGLSADYLGFNHKWTGLGTDVNSKTEFNYDAPYHVMTITPNYRFKLDSADNWGLRVGLGVGFSLSDVNWAQKLPASGAQSKAGTKVAGGAIYQWTGTETTTSSPTLKSALNTFGINDNQIAANSHHCDGAGGTGAGSLNINIAPLVSDSSGGTDHFGVSYGAFDCSETLVAGSLASPIVTGHGSSKTSSNPSFDSGLSGSASATAAGISHRGLGTDISGGQSKIAGGLNDGKLTLDPGSSGNVDYAIWSAILGDATKTTGINALKNYTEFESGAAVTLVDSVWGALSDNTQVALVAAGVLNVSRAQTACSASGGTFDNGVCTPPTPAAAGGGSAKDDAGFVLAPQVALEYDNNLLHFDINVKYIHELFNVRYFGSEGSVSGTATSGAITYTRMAGPLALFIGAGLGINF